MRKVVHSKNILWGVPRLDKTRLSIYDIVSSLWHTKEMDSFSEEFSVSKEEIKNVLSYCKSLKCQEDNVINYCDGCVLRTINGDYKKENYIQIEDGVFINQKGEFYLSDNLKDLENEEFGFLGWSRADILYDSFFSSDR